MVSGIKFIVGIIVDMKVQLEVCRVLFSMLFTFIKDLKDGGTVNSTIRFRLK